MLFELTLIFLLIACYCGFWVLSKRKFGSAEQTIPSGVVRTYLNQMINDAQGLRSQLFGLLAGIGGVSPQALQTEPRFSVGAAPVAPQMISDPELKKRLSELEGQLAAQKSSLDIVLKEKTELEKALLLAKSQSTPGAAAAPADATETNKLKDQIKELEDRLAEYSVIEDDLANLKRLQQENAKLKALLEQKGSGSKIEASDVIAATTSTPQMTAPVPKSSVAAAAAAAVATAAAPPTTPAVEPDKGAADALNFEGLVDKVEESLKESMDPPSTPEAAPPSAEKQAQAPATPAAPNATGTPTDPKTPEGEATGKSDEDLISEFEKMLNM